MDQSPQKPEAGKQESPAELPKNSKRRWLLTILGAICSLAVIYFILFLANPGASVLENVLVTILVGVFPISYLAFEVRAGQRKDRLVSRINLLGFADEREQERWEKLYRNLNPPQEYILFVSLVVLVSMFGFGLLRLSNTGVSGLEELLGENALAIMFFSFLGAYVFSIYNVSRRYLTYDMAPGVYLQTAILMITVIAIGYIFALFLEAQPPASDQLFEIPEAIIPIIAFLIGYIPESGIRMFRVISSRYFKPDDRSELTLGKVGGISIWHETRLRESGVDNVQNLAAMDIRQLLLTSRYSMQQVINWVDQAILLTTLPESTINFLQANGINTMTSLIRLVAQIPAPEPEQIKLAPIDANADLTHDELVLLATFIRSVLESSPNLAYVQAYWEAIGKVETAQIRAQTKNVLADITRQGASPIFASDQTLDLLSNLVKASTVEEKDLIEAFAKDAASAVGLANAYIENNSYNKAIKILTATIEEYRDRDEDLSPAYACRGLAHGFLAMKYKPEEKEFTDHIQKSDMDFKKAIESNRKYPVTYIYQGALLLQRKELDNALAALDQAIALDPTVPKAFLTRGKIYSNRTEYDQAITDFSRAIQLAEARDLQSIMKDAYYERATLYLNSAKPDEAKRDFDEEILLDSHNPLAYLGRGKSLLLRGSKTLELSGNISYAVLFPISRAITDFETAIDLYKRQQKEHHQDKPDSNTALAYSNIAQAYFQIEQYIDAVTNIQRAFDLGDQSLINFKVRGLSYLKIGEFKPALGDLTFYLSNLPANSTEQPVMQVIVDQVQKKLNPPAT